MQKTGHLFTCMHNAYWSYRVWHYYYCRMYNMDSVGRCQLQQLHHNNNNTLSHCITTNADARTLNCRKICERSRKTLSLFLFFNESVFWIPLFLLCSFSVSSHGRTNNLNNRKRVKEHTLLFNTGYFLVCSKFSQLLKLFCAIQETFNRCVVLSLKEMFRPLQRIR